VREDVLDTTDGQRSDPTDLDFRTDGQDSVVAIEFRGLAKSFGDIEAVQSLDLKIPRGQICGYLGPNGAGKTTTVKMATGMISPTSGTALINGIDIAGSPLKAKLMVGVVPETGALYENLTPIEYLTLVGRLYHLESDAALEKAEEFLRLFGIADSSERMMTGFSRGMRQKVLISAALLHNPDILFLDEPLAGLDANTALILKELLRELASRGKTVFYCSHILEVVEKVCDRVVILNRGEVVADGDVDELKEMTHRASLEDAFTELTSEDDLGAIVKAFSHSITGRAREAGNEQ
jgi:ABC-2 type transport system ATP-binding protein